MSGEMTTIEVDHNTATILEALKAKAEAQGMTLEELLRVITADTNGTQEKPFFETATPEERAHAVEEWASRHRSSAPPLSDEAISRESIYGERVNDRYQHPF